MLGDGVRVHAGRVRHGHAARAARREIDVIRSGAPNRDEAHPVARGEHVLGEARVRANVHHHLGVADPANQFGVLVRAAFRMNADIAERAKLSLGGGSREHGRVVVRYDYRRHEGVVNRLTARDLLLLSFPPLPPLARWIVIRVRRFLRRASCLGHIPQIDPNARPGRRPPAHRIHEHVVDREMRRRFGVLGFPSLEPLERGGFVRRVRHDDERHFRSRRALLGGAIPSPSRAMARRVAPRLPSCESAAAMAHRRGRRPRHAPQARAALE